MSDLVSQPVPVKLNPNGKLSVIKIRDDKFLKLRKSKLQVELNL
jgi:hypothetical protein